MTSTARTVAIPLPPLAGFIDALDPLPGDALDALWHRFAIGEISAAQIVDEPRPAPAVAGGGVS